VVYVGLSQVEVLSKRLNRSIEVVFGTEAILELSLIVLKGNSGRHISKNIVPNTEFSLLFCFIRHCTSIIADVVNLVGLTTVASLSH